MNRIVLRTSACVLGVLLAGIGNIANAQSSVNWSGYYIGAQVGKSSNSMNWQFNNANYFNTLGATVVGTDFNLNSNGNIRGGYAGYNYLISSFVFGMEASAVDVNMNASSTSPFFPATDTFSSQLRWVTAVKARLGYAYSRFLLSLSGGWSRGSVDLSLKDTPSNILADTTQIANGWNVGAAIDFRLTNNFSVGAAYDYTKLKVGNSVMSCPTCGTGTGFGIPVVSGDIKMKAVTARLSYYI